MNENTVSTRKFQEVIPLAPNSIYKYKRLGFDLTAIYNVFTNPSLTTREKKDYLYSVAVDKEECKDCIWEAYVEKNLDSFFMEG